MYLEIEDVQLIFEDMKERTEKSIKSLQHELAALRAGRANPHILEGITVDYYGTPLLLTKYQYNHSRSQIALHIGMGYQHDKKVEKAIIDANIGIMPTNDGKVIRLVFPEPTEEEEGRLLRMLKFCRKTKSLSAISAETPLKKPRN